MEFLQGLFGDKTLTYQELKAAVEKAGLKVADLSEGGYVDKQKFDNKVEEITNVQAQLTIANETIKSFQKKDTDMETVKQKAEAYDKDKQAWEQKTTEMQKNYSLREELMLAGAKNPKAAAAVLDLSKAEFKDGKWTGLKELIEESKKSDGYMYTETEGNPGKAKEKDPIFAKPGGAGGKSITSEEFKKMTYEQKAELYQTNKSLYDEIKGV